MKPLVDGLYRWTYRGLYLAACVYWTVCGHRFRGVYVAVWHGGRVLLVHNTYKRGWTMPGGLVQRRETARQGAARELAEEVGIRVDAAALVYEGEFVGRYLKRHETCHLFRLDCPTPPQTQVDGREVDTAELVAPADALVRRLHRGVGAYLRYHGAGGPWPFTGAAEPTTTG